ncbi:hypothetical protein ONS96_000191 [Cadophora gregata f. sp. sojae]|nr:hypothetical protein ONS96_000191 [Cadophora gregata f. sp. sojae]
MRVMDPFQNLNSIFSIFRKNGPEATATFVLWAKTGKVYSNLHQETLWAYGKRFSSELFTNEVMFCMYARDKNRSILAEEARLAYSVTTTGSKLRTYIRKLVAFKRPLEYAPASESKTIKSEDRGDLYAKVASWFLMSWWQTELLSPKISQMTMRWHLLLSKSEPVS